MKFICDVMLGKLGRWLRMMGHDTEIASDELTDRDILNIAEEEGRLVLTRDSDLKKMNSPVEVILLDSRDFEDQLKRVFTELDLDTNFPEGSRCSHCNSELKEVGESEWVCKGCGQEYWKGSHWDRIKEIEKRLENLN